jgi:hypothetical protein
MPAPLQLDTSRPDWRRQARAQGTCKGATCGAKILWVITDRDGGKERWTPYNYDDGRIHHSTCPDVESFKRDSRPAASTAAPPAAKPEPARAAAPEQQTMFGPMSPKRYGVD